jgi:glycosyltransferase involved in cell wall biosynthesis
MFTVIIPLFNKSEYIKRCLKSVVSQTIYDIDIIIIDAGSTDGSLEYVKEVQSRDERIRLVEQPNYGYGYAKNTGAFLAGTDYITFIDADDEWGNEFLSEMKRLIEIYPFASAFVSAFTIVEESGSESIICYSKRFADGYIEDFMTKRERGWGPHTSSTVFRKEAFVKSGGFPITMFSVINQKTWIINGSKCIKYELPWVEPNVSSTLVKCGEIATPTELADVTDLRLELPGAIGEDQYIFDYFAFEEKCAFSSKVLSKYYRNIPGQTIRKTRRGRFYCNLLQILDYLDRNILIDYSRMRDMVGYYRYLSAGLFTEVIHFKKIERIRFLENYKLTKYWGGSLLAVALVNLTLWRMKRKLNHWIGKVRWFNKCL